MIPTLDWNPGLTQKLPQFPLQLQMHLEGAVEEPGATAPGAVLLQGMDARLHHIRGRGQTQIVVGTQHDAALALHHHLHILPGLEGVEIGIHPRRLQFLRQRRLIAFLKNIHSSLLLCNIKYQLFSFCKPYYVAFCCNKYYIAL